MNLFRILEVFLQFSSSSRGYENANFFSFFPGVVHSVSILEILSQWPPLKTKTPLCWTVDLNSNLQGSLIFLFKVSCLLY